MPRAKAQAKQEPAFVQKGKYAPSQPGEVEWGGFINIRISDETKAIYAAWLGGDGSSFWSMLEDAMVEGLKYTVVWDVENNCYISSLTGNGCLGFNLRFSLSARSDRFEDATALLIFKHAVMCEGNWGNFRPHTGTVNNWG